MHRTAFPARAASRGPRPAVAALVWMVLASTSAADGPPPAIDFNREIRPILSNHCFQCHGPDANKRKRVSKPLRLDTEAGAFSYLAGDAASVRGEPEEIERVRRITSEQPTE